MAVAHMASALISSTEIEPKEKKIRTNSTEEKEGKKERKHTVKCRIVFHLKRKTSRMNITLLWEPLWRAKKIIKLNGFKNLSRVYTVKSPQGPRDNTDI